MAKMLRIAWTKSGIGYPRDQRLTIKSLGLRRLQHVVEKEDTSVIRGMLVKVRHLVQVEEIP
ncbi:MAG: 50S ribosomal protein L30 [Dehalococcoidia bacterium]|nr:50S ribosomal protein L30 [Dehalococcoidia bacterium]